VAQCYQRCRSQSPLFFLFIFRHRDEPPDSSIDGDCDGGLPPLQRLLTLKLLPPASWLVAGEGGLMSRLAMLIKAKGYF
jgi:hypothetical protein